MYEINLTLTPSQAADEQQILRAAEQHLKFRPNTLAMVQTIRRSVDARAVFGKRQRLCFGIGACVGLLRIVILSAGAVQRMAVNMRFVMIFISVYLLWLRMIITAECELSVKNAIALYEDYIILE